MNVLATITMKPFEVIVGIIIFLILFPIILKCLRCMPLFQDRSSILTAVCVSLLCILGPFRFLIAPAESASKNNPDRNSFDFILLFYAALALAILLLLLLLLLMRIRKVFDTRRRRLSDDRHSQISKYSGASERQVHTSHSEYTSSEDKTTNKRQESFREKLKNGKVLPKESSDREFK